MVRRKLYAYFSEVVISCVFQGNEKGALRYFAYAYKLQSNGLENVYVHILRLRRNTLRKEADLLLEKENLVDLVLSEKTFFRNQVEDFTSVSLHVHERQHNKFSSIVREIGLLEEEMFSLKKDGPISRKRIRESCQSLFPISLPLLD